VTTTTIVRVKKRKEFQITRLRLSSRKTVVELVERWNWFSKKNTINFQVSQRGRH